jgi:uncharacterized protein YbjT (DUF2867 family)
MNKTACIFGSTGLIGSYLLELLLNDEKYTRIIVFNRKQQLMEHPKLIQIADDYTNLHEHDLELNADEYFCCLGTTINIAKTKPAFEYVDYHLPLEIGNLALTNKVKYYLVVSSIGASAKSKNFYLRTKGGMENALSKLGLDNLFIFRPSMLLGNRKEKRIGESVSKVFMLIFGIIMIGPLKKYKAIRAKNVAEAMIKSVEKYSGIQFIESDKIKVIARF